MTGRSRRRLLCALGSTGAVAGLPGCFGLGDDPAEGSDGPDGLTGEWPTFAGDARNTGVVEASGPTTEPTVAWEFETAGTVYDGVAVADGAVFVPSTDGSLYAVEADDGAERWRSPVRGQVRTTPAVAGETVLVGGDDGGLYALDITTGAQRWSALTDAGVAPSHPVVVDGTVYVGWQASAGGGPGATETGGVDAVSVDGDREWRIEPGAVKNAPTVVEGVVYAGTPAAAHAFDAADGEELWRFEPAGNTGSPTIADGLAFLGSMSSRFYAVDAATGEQAWELTPGKWPNYAPAVADGVLYLCSWATRVYAVDAATGERRWVRSLENPLSDPVVADGTVYVAPENTLVALREE